MNINDDKPTETREDGTKVWRDEEGRPFAVDAIIHIAIVEKLSREQFTDMFFNNVNFDTNKKVIKENEAKEQERVERFICHIRSGFRDCFPEIEQIEKEEKKEQQEREERLEKLIRILRPESTSA